PRTVSLHRGDENGRVPGPAVAGRPAGSGTATRGRAPEGLGRRLYEGARDPARAGFRRPYPLYPGHARRTAGGPNVLAGAFSVGTSRRDARYSPGRIPHS